MHISRSPSPSLHLSLPLSLLYFSFRPFFHTFLILYSYRSLYPLSLSLYPLTLSPISLFHVFSFRLFKTFPIPYAHLSSSPPSLSLSLSLSPSLSLYFSFRPFSTTFLILYSYHSLSHSYFSFRLSYSLSEFCIHISLSLISLSLMYFSFRLFKTLSRIPYANLSLLSLHLSLLSLYTLSEFSLLISLSLYISLFAHFPLLS